MQHVIIEALRRVVDRYGDRIAIESDHDESLSFAELWRKMETVAGELRSCGVGPRDVVAVHLPRSARAILSLLAIWHIGATYLPIGDDWPAARVAFALEDAQPKAVIDDASPGIRVTPRSITLEAEGSPAHLIYTSGSTGAPKGVLVSDRGILSVLEAQIAKLGLGPGKRCLLVLSLAFDASLSDIGTALLSGATLVIPSAPLLRDPESLIATLVDRRITHVDLPPAIVMKIDPERDLPSSCALEHVILGGEPCARDALLAWSKCGIQMTIAYGPTEATICTSMARFDPHKNLADEGGAPIGHPLPGVRYRLDENDGELLIGGPCLAIGYHRRPDLDRARFVVDDNDGTRWFKTGDRVRVLSDGSYAFLGRTDRQFKLRGFLIAPEEIEAALLRLPNIRRAVVMHRSDEIVAFLESDGEIIPTDIRRALEKALPAIMCPRRILRLAPGELPTTSTGKPDYHALSTIERTENGPIESVLRELFASVLRIDREAIDGAIDADFFALGGDSFAVLDLVAAARARAIDLSPASVYEHRNLRDLAAHTRRFESGDDAISVGEIRADVQRRLAAHPRPAARSSSPRGAARSRHVLLTGATGFLGARVLKHLALLRDDNEIHRIYCIVRGGQRARLSAEAQADARVVVIDGDLTRAHLGLPPDVFGELASVVTDVFHLAAAVDMVRPFSLLAPPNIDGTIEVLRFANAAHARLHYASTLSVFASTNQKSSGLLREEDDLSSTPDSTLVYGGYAQTKFAAELAVRSIKTAAPTTIHRFGLLTSDATPFVSPRGCQLTLFLRGLLELGAIPEEIAGDAKNIHVDITPIDYAARAMIQLALAASTTSQTFHIANPTSLCLHDITIAAARVLGRPIARVPLDTLAPNAMLLVSLLRRSRRSRVSSDLHSTDLFLATGCDFDTARTASRLAERDIVCPSAHTILDAHLRASGPVRSSIASTT